MEREIKFRAWNESRKEMYNVHGWHSEFCFKDTLDGVGTEGNPDNLSDVKLMQYTGLKDKNGKEIYEGDIIKNHQADENEVFWWGNGWHYRNYHAEALPLDDLWNPYRTESYVDGEPLTGHEVIGNIYENPELIDKNNLTQ